MSAHRLAAAFALVLAGSAVALQVILVAVDPPRGVVGSALLAVAVTALWYGVVRRGAVRVAGAAFGMVVAVGAAGSLIGAHPALGFGALLALVLAIAAGGYAFRAQLELPVARRPAHPVMFWNPRSGGGKAVQFHLREEASARGIDPIELNRGVDVEKLAYEAIDAGADALAVAGGDGSMARVARIAAERGVPFVCIPAGTRNHFARDLGVDPNDVVGALDALVDGVERSVDLAEVNGRTFLNNVSLGVYGEAVQRADFRDEKVRTLLDTAPTVRGSHEHPKLHWRSPEGVEHEGSAEILVSNNAYRPGHVLSPGARPHLDEGVLGVMILGAPGDQPRARTWTTAAYQVDSDAPVPVGIDGEPLVLEPPLRFQIHPRALRCRIARHHPGASLSAFAPDRAWGAIRMLGGIAAGRAPHGIPPTH